MLLKLMNSSKPCIIDDEDFEKCSKYNWYLVDNGYIMTSIYTDENKWQFILLHRFILGLTRGDKLVVHHIDTNRQNNSKSNLEALTKKQHSSIHMNGKLNHNYGKKFHLDTRYKISKSRTGKCTGETNPLSKLNWNIVIDIRDEYKLNKHYGLIPELAKKYNVNTSTIERVIYNKTWRTR